MGFNRTCWEDGERAEDLTVVLLRFRPDYASPTDVSDQINHLDHVHWDQAQSALSSFIISSFQNSTKVLL